MNILIRTYEEPLLLRIENKDNVNITKFIDDLNQLNPRDTIDDLMKDHGIVGELLQFDYDLIVG